MVPFPAIAWHLVVSRQAPSSRLGSGACWARGMRDGAVGLSTGLIYVPGSFAKTEEIVELAKVASKHGGIYASHMRAETVKIFEALDELFRIAREAKIPAEVSHLKLSGPSA